MTSYLHFTAWGPVLLTAIEVSRSHAMTATQRQAWLGRQDMLGRWMWP